MTFSVFDCGSGNCIAVAATADSERPSATAPAHILMFDFMGYLQRLAIRKRRAYAERVGSPASDPVDQETAENRLGAGEHAGTRARDSTPRRSAARGSTG